MYKRTLIGILVLTNIFFNVPLDKTWAKVSTPALPDLEVTSLTSDQASGAQEKGTLAKYITFTAQVTNKGQAQSGNFRYVWKIIDENREQVVNTGLQGTLLPGKSALISYKWLKPDFDR
jgi:hypothetical protein